MVFIRQVEDVYDKKIGMGELFSHYIRITSWVQFVDGILLLLSNRAAWLRQLLSVNKVLLSAKVDQTIEARCSRQNDTVGWTIFGKSPWNIREIFELNYPIKIKRDHSRALRQPYMYVSMT